MTMITTLQKSLHINLLAHSAMLRNSKLMGKGRAMSVQTSALMFVPTKRGGESNEKPPVLFTCTMCHTSPEKMKGISCLFHPIQSFSGFSLLSDSQQQQKEQTTTNLPTKTPQIHQTQQQIHRKNTCSWHVHFTEAAHQRHPRSWNPRSQRLRIRDSASKTGQTSGKAMGPWGFSPEKMVIFHGKVLGKPVDSRKLQWFDTVWLCLSL